jgi:hypothetical protein
MFTPFRLFISLTVSLAAISLCAAVTLTLPTAQTMTGGEVEAKFRGEWVPAKVRCTSPLRVIIGTNVVTFVKDADRAEFRKLDQCFTCMGRDVENITILSTDAMGDSPFMIYLDGSKKRAVVTVEFPNDKTLAARFPFGKTGLKKCK